MDDDQSWLKNPILPRPPALPRFSAAELRLVDEERPSSVMRVAPRAARSSQVEHRRHASVSGTTRTRATESAPADEAPRSRRIA